MMPAQHLLAFDPGLRCAGLCVLDLGTGRVVRAAAGMATPGMAGQGPDVWRSTMADTRAKLDGLNIVRVVAEWPQIYDTRKTDPSPLLLLAAIDGMLAAMYPDAEMTTITPRQWKGQRPKEATTAQALRVLGADELAAIEAGCRRVPPALHHNVWDAVALGLITLHRMR